MPHVCSLPLSTCREKLNMAASSPAAAVSAAVSAAVAAAVSAVSAVSAMLPAAFGRRSTDAADAGAGAGADDDDLARIIDRSCACLTGSCAQPQIHESPTSCVSTGSAARTPGAASSAATNASSVEATTVAPGNALRTVSKPATTSAALVGGPWLSPRQS